MNKRWFFGRCTSLLLAACGSTGHTGYGCDIGANDLTLQICIQVTTEAKCEDRTYVQEQVTICPPPQGSPVTRNCCQFMNCETAPKFPKSNAVPCN